MAIVHRERPLPDWSGFMLPERWRRMFDLDLEQSGWLKLEEYWDDGTLVLRTEVPGVDPSKDLEVTVAEGVLRVHAHREEKAERKNKDHYRSEFRYGELTRTVRLPEGVSGDDVKATYGDGVLEIRIPVPTEKEPEAKKVPVTKV
jgi:HSP20 family protein